MKTIPKIAVIAYGEYREFETAVNSWPFINSDEYDVFISTWNISKYENEKLNINLNEIVDIDKIKSIIPTSTVSILNVDEYIRIYELPNIYKMFFHWNNGLNLIENSGNLYDYIILTRMDSFFIKKTMNAIDEIKSLKLYTLYGDSEINLNTLFPTTQDIFFIGHYNIISNFIRNIMYSPISFGIHETIADWVLLNDIKLERQNMFNIFVLRPTLRNVDISTISDQILITSQNEWWKSRQPNWLLEYNLGTNFFENEINENEPSMGNKLKKNNMKIAICFSGLIRTGCLAYPNIINFIGELLPNCDFFIHTWNIDEDKSPPISSKECDTQLHNYLTIPLSYELLPSKKNKILELYKPKKYKIDDNLIKNISISNTAPLWISVHETNKLKTQYELEHDFKYDYVINTRLDILFEPHYKLINEINLLKNNKVNPQIVVCNYTTDTNKTSFIDDVLWISNSKDMDNALEFINTTITPREHLVNNNFIIHNSVVKKYTIFRRMSTHLNPITDFTQIHIENHNFFDDTQNGIIHSFNKTIQKKRLI
jgi:hypothetical protein